MRERHELHDAFDSRQVTLEMLGLLGRAVIAGVVVSATAALVVVGFVAAAA